MKINNRNKGWCEDEDKIISQLVQKYGTKNWAQIAEQLHLVYGYTKKTGKQCRERWHNHLDPNIIKKSWTMAQQNILFNEHKINGNRWTTIAEKLPGRTDNSIKNHFYSTIRKSLRRISKFMGSKNSTSKMRQIKPSTLSKILDLVQGKPNQQNKTKEQQNCKQIAHYLMDFARCKLSDKKYILTQQDNKTFQRILQQMSTINKIYEDQKLVQAKIKKEKLLEKNFDQASQSEFSQQEQKILKQQDHSSQQILVNVKTQDNQIFLTRSNRKVKPPSIYQATPMQKKQKQKQNDKEKSKDKLKDKSKGKNKQIKYLKQAEIKQEECIYGSFNYILQSPFLKSRSQHYLDVLQMEQLPKIIDHNINENDEGKFQFSIQLQDQQDDQENRQKDRSICQLGSPGFRNTPMDLTPKTYQFMRQFQPQPLKNQDCNLAFNKIMNDIKRNTNCQLEVPQKPLSIRSPSSAFRQYC